MKNDKHQRLKKAIRSGNVDSIQTALDPPIREFNVYICDGDLDKDGNQAYVCQKTGKVLTEEEIKSILGKYYNIDFTEDNASRVRRGQPAIKTYYGVDPDRV